MNRDILILVEDLKSMETTPPMDGCLVWLVGGLVGQIMWNHLKFNKTWSNWDNSILFEDLWFVDTLPTFG